MVRFLVLPLALILFACAVQDQRRGPPGAPPRGGGMLFISPMGEPFRGDAASTRWFDAADTDHDGRLTYAEFAADALRWFAILDRNGDGEIDPGDVEHYENVLAPEIRVRDGGPDGRGDRGGGRHGPGGQDQGGGGPGGGGPGGGSGEGGGMGGRGFHFGSTEKSAASEKRGAARYGYLDLPEPVTAADANLNRGVDRMEWTRAAMARFALLDRNHDGALSRSELPPAGAPARGFAPPPDFGRAGGPDDE